MPQLPEKAIDEFQVLWKEHFDKELTHEDAAFRASQIVVLVKLLMDDVNK